MNLTACLICRARCISDCWYAGISPLPAQICLPPHWLHCCSSSPAHVHGGSLAVLQCPVAAVCCSGLEWMNRACDAESAQTPPGFSLDPGKERHEVKYMLASKVTSCSFAVLPSHSGRFNFNIPHLIRHQLIYVHLRRDLEAMCGIHAQTHTHVHSLKNSLLSNNSNHCIFILAVHYSFASQICKYYHKRYPSICILCKSWPRPSLWQFESRN